MVYVTSVISDCIPNNTMIYWFVRFSGEEIHSIAKCVIVTRDPETEGHVMICVTFCFVRLLSHVDHDVILRFRVHT